MTRTWTDPYNDLVASYRQLQDHKRAMACVLFPNQCERKIAVSEVINLMESLTLPWDQNSTQKPVPETQKRQTTYRKIQERVPLQEKIKEDNRIRIKDFTKRRQH